MAILENCIELIKENVCLKMQRDLQGNRIGGR